MSPISIGPEKCPIDRALKIKMVSKKALKTNLSSLRTVYLMIPWHSNGIDYMTYPIEIAISFRRKVHFQ